MELWFIGINQLLEIRRISAAKIKTFHNLKSVNFFEKFSKMPTSCLVPGCKTGYTSYKGPKYRHVSLPKSPKLLEIWLSKIKRIDYHPSTSGSGKICMKHFCEDDLIPEHENLGCKGKQIFSKFYKRGSPV